MDNRGTSPHKKWSEEELLWLEFAYGHESTRFMAHFLGRSVGSIAGMAHRLGLCTNIKKVEVTL